ncbi:MAG: TIGR04372 family glycosyltransferase [Elusimicrobiota bacterium]
MLRKAAKGLALILAVPFVLLARLLRPIFTIRFGRLREDRIGHLAMNTEYYLCRHDEPGGGGTLDLFFYGAAANMQLMLMWSRVLTMSRLVWPAWKLNTLLPGGKANEVDLPLTNADYERARDLFTRHAAHLFFTPEEEDRGRRALRMMGVPQGMPFVCFHARDAAFLERTSPSKYGYHDYRDSSIKNFLPAARALTSRGYALIRMGAVVAEPLDSGDTLVIDYASRHRTEFLDIFLAGKCAFFIAANSGIADVAETFRRPQLRTNVTQFFAELLLTGPKDVFITKRVWLEKEERFMSLRELVSSPAWEIRCSGQLEALGIKLIENTAEEILEAATELEERLRGVWRETPEDLERQRIFWKILQDAGKLNQPPVSRIAAGFLRRHPEILELPASRL